MSGDIEVRELRYFVAVAEELHFGRAAERLGMAQPPLSRSIRELERRLGVTLLERTTRRVTLTAAGRAFLRDARVALEAVTAAEQRARHAGRPEPGLRLAMKADYDAGLLPRILDAYHREDAAVPVDLLMGGRGEQAPALRAGLADVALLPAPFDDRDLDHEPLVTEPRLAALAAADPLAARPSLVLADLVGRVLPDGAAAHLADPQPLRGLGTAPQPRRLPTVPTGVAGPPPAGSQQRYRDLAQIFTLVELGAIVWFPPESVARRHPRSGIAYREVRDLGPSTLCVAWPRQLRSAAVAAFVRAAAAVAAPALKPVSALIPVSDSA
ncbi:LysR family transcriptional regulator [Frankia sp. AgB32]|uniref:LysR family transcriptional regulator n=1 Tax=Frankia sp. AgB32 TaxID=631119 RepID=UPI00200BDEAC|nr:LysR family transcriptional regulator [Frankia sp. AgB32]MCK9895307.1 LysR family transcriptional regulator [Frankia sp. AgB32]